MTPEQIIMQYSEEQMELLKTILKNAAKKSTPKFYEILVDTLKAVEKTNDVEEFDSYLNFINTSSRQVEVRFFYSQHSPKYEKHLLFISNTPPPPIETKSVELSGVEIQNRITETITAEREKWERDAEQKELKKELKEKEDTIKENEKYIGELEQTVIELRQQRNTFKGIHLGEIAGAGFEYLLRNNAKLLEKYPLTKGLAGIIAQSNEEQKAQLHAPTENAEVQFSSNDHAATISEEDQQHVAFLKQLQGVFKEEEIKDLFAIIDVFSKDHSQLKTVKELLQNNNN